MKPQHLAGVLIAIGALGVAAVTILISEKSDSPETATVQQADTRTPEKPYVPTSTPEPVKTAIATTAKTSSPEGASAKKTPSAFRGASVDGSVKTDENGNLIIDRELRRLFDYFLLATETDPLEDAVNRLKKYLEDSVEQPALDQVLSVLDQYLAYKMRLVELEEGMQLADGQANTATTEKIAQHLDAVSQLRREMLTAEVVEAFFGAEESHNRYLLARFQILSNPNLTDAQKAEQLALLTGSLPPETREAMERPYFHSRLSNQTEALRASGANESEIRQLRMATVGPEATARLEALDTRRKEWSNRLERYRNERKEILANKGLSELDRQQALEALLERSFKEDERIRVRALDRISGLY